MCSHEAELALAHVHAHRAFSEWGHLKDHLVKHYANVQLSKLWEAWALERQEAGLFNVWLGLALLRTCYLVQAVVERAWFRGRLTTTRQDLVDTPILSVCMALLSTLPPLPHWAKGYVGSVARQLAAGAWLHFLPPCKSYRSMGACELLEPAMLQCLQGGVVVADLGDGDTIWGSTYRATVIERPALTKQPHLLPRGALPLGF